MPWHATYPQIATWTLLQLQPIIGWWSSKPWGRSGLGRKLAGRASRNAASVARRNGAFRTARHFQRKFQTCCLMFYPGPKMHHICMRESSPKTGGSTQFHSGLDICCYHYTYDIDIMISDHEVWTCPAWMYRAFSVRSKLIFSGSTSSFRIYECTIEILCIHSFLYPNWSHNKQIKHMFDRLTKKLLSWPHLYGYRTRVKLCWVPGASCRKAPQTLWSRCHQTSRS